VTDDAFGQEATLVSDLTPLGSNDTGDANAATTHVADITAHDSTVDDTAPRSGLESLVADIDPSWVHDLDRGATTALRTVRTKKRVMERLPLVGHDEATTRQRIALLSSLEDSTHGHARAELWLSIASLYEEIGEHTESEHALKRAIAADDSYRPAIRAVRLHAIAKGDWGEALAQLEREAELCSSIDEAAHLRLLAASITLHTRAEPEVAQSLAQRATQQQPSLASAALVWSDALQQDGKHVESRQVLRNMMESWEDHPAAAALYIQIGLEEEREQRVEAALQAYQKATSLEPTLGAALGVLRTAPHSTSGSEVADALQVAAATSHAPAVREALRWYAGQILMRDPHHLPRAFHLQRERDGLPSRRLYERIARRMGAMRERIEQLQALADTTSGAYRARMLLELAEALIDQGQIDDAREIVLELGRSEDCKPMAKVVAELGRIPLDITRVLEQVDSDARDRDAREAYPAPAVHQMRSDQDAASRRDEHTLAAYASLAAALTTVDDPAHERDQLQQALHEDEQSAALCALSIDIGLQDDDSLLVLREMQRHRDHESVSERVLRYIALEEYCVRIGQLQTAQELLERAHALAPQHPLVSRTLARRSRALSHVDHARYWLHEAKVTDGEQGAFAANYAARLLEATDEDAAIDAYWLALEHDERFLPAMWALERLYRRRGDVQALQRMHEQAAPFFTSPMDVSGRLVRAALLIGATQAEHSKALLERAYKVHPSDSILQDLLLRLDAGASPTERAQWLLLQTKDAPADVARAARIRAGAVLEDAGLHAEAAGIYREVYGAHPDDRLVERVLNRAELAARDYTRLGERWFASARESKSDEQTIRTLERLAWLDQHVRGDASNAILSYQAILEYAPGHIAALRSLERAFFEQGRDEELAQVEQLLASHLAFGPDVAAHARMAVTLWNQLNVDEHEVIGPFLDSIAPDVVHEPWFARKLEAWGRTSQNPTVRAMALQSMLSHSDHPLTYATWSLRLAEAVSTDDTDLDASARELLEPALARAPRHPTLAEELARVYERTGSHERAAETYELAAEAADVPNRKAAFWYRAGLLWQNSVGNDRRAAANYSRVAEIDVCYADVFGRLQHLFTEYGELHPLADVIEARIRAGGSPADIMQLHRAVAEIYRKTGELDKARVALQSALDLQPEDRDTLEALVHVCRQQQDWARTAEMLIRLARVVREQDVLVSIFLEIGSIYDTRIADPRRAEVAYRRVLRFDPHHIDALERLGRLYMNERDLRKAADIYETLVRVVVDPERRTEHQVQLAKLVEQLGDVRQAELLFEQVRRTDPTHLGHLREFADFYRRQGANAAFSVHMSRAQLDFVHKLEANVADPDAWHGLMEVLRWRGRLDAARCCASAGMMLGVHVEDYENEPEIALGIPGAEQRALNAELDDLLCPPELSASTKAVFEIANPVLEKLLPFDLRSLRADKLSQRNHTFALVTEQVKQWFGLDQIQLLVTDVLPNVCVPIGNAPVRILLGRSLLHTTHEVEKRFMIARAVKIATSHLSIAARSRPSSVALVLSALVRVFDPQYQPLHLDFEELEALTLSIKKMMGRKERTKLMVHALEMARTHHFHPENLAFLASQHADRVALLATGSLHYALSSLIKLVGEERAQQAGATDFIAVATHMPEARDLFFFALSDPYFEARSRSVP
jgi:tetratricopeptide (TPR) repeat protein